MKSMERYFKHLRIMKVYFVCLLLCFLILLIGCSNNKDSVEKNHLQEKEINQPINTLTEAERQVGWKLLFDGKTTNGWRAIYKDRFPAKGWEIENGNLTCLGTDVEESERGGAIITVDKYANFELSLEFKMKEGANSGIKYFVDESLRSSPGHGLGLEYQILDDDNYPYETPGLPRTCASLYDLVHAHNKTLRPIGEFNRAGIVVKGNHIEHWLNGQKVLEIEKGSEEYKALVAKSKYKDIEGWGEFPEGHILLQDEGPRISFRNIKIRKL